MERDAAAASKGTATIKGRVLTVDGRPLRRATISINGAELSDHRNTSTGLEGEYVIDELPAGRYTIIVSRSGYLTVRYGQTRYGEPASTLDVSNGQAIENVNFVLERAGVISGRILDETGDPAAGVQVWALQPQFFRGTRRLVPVNSSQVRTDDAGAYRLLALPPGDYVVVGMLRDTWMSDEKEPRMLAYAPTYFPGTAQAAEAQRVRVLPAQEAAAVDFTLAAMRAATISGTAVASDGAPLSGGNVAITSEVSGPTFASMTMISNVRVADDGAWTLRDVAPGDYTLRATGTADRGSETAAVKVSVQGIDLTGIVLTGDAGALVSGTVVTDSGEPLPAGQITVNTALATGELSQVRPAPGKDDGVVGANGSFLRKSMSGAVIVRVSGLTRGWALKSVMIGGRDYAGAPLELQAGRPVSGLTVVISKRLSSLRGRILDDQGNPAEGIAIVFPVDPARWAEAGASTRVAKADRAGAFQIDTVRPGQYFAVAVPYVQQWQLNDPEFLGALRERAMKLTIRDDPATIDLKVVR